MNEPRLLVATEVAELTRSSLRHVREMTARGELPVLRFGGKVLYPLDALQRYIAENTAAPAHVNAGASEVAVAARKRRRGKAAQPPTKAAQPHPAPVSASGRARPIRLDGAS